MYHEENRKILTETQHFKDKVDSLKMELYELRKLHKENLDYKIIYEDLKAREEERHTQEIRVKTAEEIIRQRERHSLIGHLKQVRLSNTVTQKVSTFSLETFKCLEFEDIIKLVGLNRRFSQTFLKYNSRLFIRMQNQRCREMAIRIKDLIN